MAFETVTSAAMASLAPNPVRRSLPAVSRLSTWTAPDGWPMRRFDWPHEDARGSILVQAGRGDVIEKYLETFGDLHDRGWAVTSFDWRGQGGSGRFAADRRVGHADGFGPWIDDLAAFWKEWRAATKGPAVILGHSMGGYLVLRALLERRIDPAAAVLVAPMLGLRSPVGAGLGLRVAQWMATHGDPARAAWKDGERPGARMGRQRMLTSDASRYEDELWWYRTEPDLALGPPSWTWLAHAFADTIALERDARLAQVTTPILMLIAEADRLVDPRAAARVAAKLPAAEVLAFGRESAHEILREADPVRDRALAAIDAFLQSKAFT